MAAGVVIVDDHAEFRVVAAALLSAGGLRVLGEAATGVEGIAAVLELRPDVVLLDVQLPDLDGFEVCGRLAGRVPVVLCSVRPAADYGDRIARCGAAGFVDKGRLSAAGLLRLAGLG